MSNVVKNEGGEMEERKKDRGGDLCGLWTILVFSFPSGLSNFPHKLLLIFLSNTLQLFLIFQIKHSKLRFQRNQHSISLHFTKL